jgi:hypothetical protein
MQMTNLLDIPRKDNPMGPVIQTGNTSDGHDDYLILKKQV